MDPELARKNVRWGLALFLFALLLFAAAIAVAEVYNSLEVGDAPPFEDRAPQP